MLVVPDGIADADTTLALDLAQRGLAGEFEDDPSLNREGYREIVDLLKAAGVCLRE